MSKLDACAGGNPQYPQRAADSESSAVTGFPHNPHFPQREAVKKTTTSLITAEWFHSLGLQLRPSDIACLRWYLPKESHDRRACVAEYVARWRAGMSDQGGGQPLQVLGRFAANYWLLTTYGIKYRPLALGRGRRHV